MRQRLLLSAFALTLLGAAGCDDDEPLMPRDAATEVRPPDTLPDTVPPTDTPRADTTPDTVPSDAGDARIDTVPNLDTGSDAIDARPDTADGGVDAVVDTGADLITVDVGVDLGG